MIDVFNPNKAATTCAGVFSPITDLCSDCPKIIEQHPQYDLMYRHAMFAEKIKGIIDALIDKLLSSVILGTNNNAFQILNELNALTTYMSLIYRKRMNDALNSTTENTVSFYRALYGIEGMEDNFDCYGIDIRSALAEFNLAKGNSSITWTNILTNYCYG